MFYKNRSSYRRLLSGISSAKKVFWIKNTIGFIISWGTPRFWIKIVNKVYGLCKNDKSNLVSIPSGRKHYFGELYSRDGFCSSQPIEFEGHLFPVSKDLKDYFTKLYGKDYMTPPPPEKREKHLIFEFKLPEDFQKERE